MKLYLKKLYEGFIVKFSRPVTWIQPRGEEFTPPLQSGLVAMTLRAPTFFPERRQILPVVGRIAIALALLCADLHRPSAFHGESFYVK